MKSSTTTTAAAVPRLVEFESHNSERLDEIQALNTALCFLCSINADVSEVEAFLWAHPEALLLEGVSRFAEESARFILATRTCPCHEKSCCKRNKRAILEKCLSKDFFYYLRQGSHQQRGGAQPVGSSNNPYTSSWSEYREDVLLLEQDIRLWRKEEFALRHSMLQVTLETQAAALKMGGDQKTTKEKQPPASQRPLLRLVNCTASIKRVGEERERDERVATMESLRERHKALVLEIRRSRQLQFRLLKQAFPGVRRHTCTR